jgi:hypothetical protein
MANPNPTPPPIEYRWKPGQSGNPGGTAKGARDKLQGDFLHALAKDFAEHGEAAIVTVRETKPDAYLRVVASLMPKQFEPADVSKVDDNAVLDAIKQKLAARAARALEKALPEGTA